MRNTPLGMIRQKCLECAGRPSAVRECLSPDCPLFIYRLGKNPNRTGVGSINRILAQKSPHNAEFYEKLKKLGSDYAELKKSALGLLIEKN
jgi:hypothetical protein